MPGAVYETVIELSAKGDISSKLDGMLGGIGNVSSGLADLASTMSGAFTGAIEKVGSLTMSMGKLAAVGAAGGLAYGVASLNAGLEKTQVSLAAIFNANGAVGSMGEGMEVSATQMAKMRKDAAELPGEFSDLVGIFRASAIPGLRAGLSVDKIRDLSANTMAAGAASGLQMDMVAREMGMLLSGRAGAHNVLGSQIFGLSGDSAKKFNASSAEDRVVLLNKQLLKFGEAKAQFGKTWEGVTSTLVDNGKSVIGALTLPVFNSLKTTLGSLNSWFDANQEHLVLKAYNWGTHIAAAFETAKSAIVEWWPTMSTFVTTFETKFLGVWQRIEPIVARIGGMVGKMAKDPEAVWGGMSKAAMLYGTMKLMGPIGSGVMGLAGEIGAGGGAAGLAGVAGPAAAALGLLAVSIYGAMDVLENTGSSMNKFANGEWDSTKKSVAEMGSIMSETSSNYRPVVDLMGTTLLMAIRNTADQFLALVKVIDYVGVTLTWVAGTAQNNWTALGDKLRGGPRPEATRDGFDQDERTFDVGESTAGVAAALTGWVAPLKKAVESGHKGKGTHIDKVEITVSGQTDPSRIARIVEGHLNSFARNPRSSRYSPNYSGAK